MSEKLKPCPFCGGMPEVVKRDVEPQGDPWYGDKTEMFVLCDCGVCLFDGAFHEGFGSHEGAKADAIAAWNRRELESASQPSMEKMAEAMHDAAIRYANGHTVDFQHEAREFLLESDSQPGGGEAYTDFRELVRSGLPEDQIQRATRLDALNHELMKIGVYLGDSTLHDIMYAIERAAPSAGNGGAEVE